MPQPIGIYCDKCEQKTSHMPGGEPLRMWCPCGNGALKPIEVNVYNSILEMEYPDSVDVAGKLHLRADLVMEALSGLIKLGHLERVSKGAGYYYKPL